MSNNLYKSAGVDVETADNLVDWLNSDEQRAKAITQNRLGSIASGIGGFAGMFRPNFQGMKQPILVASTDGVGTKVVLAIEKNTVTEGDALIFFILIL